MPHLLIDSTDGVPTLTMNRPEARNALSTEMRGRPTPAYGHAKRLVHGSLENQMERQLQMEAEAFADCASSDDFREGVTAFVVKRKAVFRGR